MTHGSEPIETALPLLPSQLRKRHESLRLAAKTQQQEGPTPSVHESHVKDEKEQELNVDSTIPVIHLSLAQEADSLTRDDDQDGLESPSASYHSGALIRAKSYSMFESTAHAHRNSGSVSPYDWGSTQPYSSATVSSSVGHVEMPTKDWINMNNKMQALELEVSHVKRTNMLLNLELDKVNGHLARLTANRDEEDGDGWRREYEFLVQQVDWMHRQLQMAQANQQQQQQQHLACTHMDHTSSTGMVLRPQYEADMTNVLRSEVKDLTASLKLWRSAFQQAEEMYRQKCDGERELKKTLQERETQLSSLVEKLTGYESEVQKSIENYEEFLRLSVEMLEDADGVRSRSYNNRNDGNSDDGDKTVRPGMGVMAEKGEIPGTFPGLRWRRNSLGGQVTTADDATLTVDQLSVAILSWLALLATYMLS
ncbi:hypothetical protein BGX31_003241 [Mortierella sp. GBA43]|nr:hypothetical protein BGX31_003241 [Mortierella sp. GBA43]